MLCRIFNGDDRRRRIGGVWIAPGETRHAEVRGLTARVIARWRANGVRIEEVAEGDPVSTLLAEAEGMDWQALRAAAGAVLGQPLPRSRAGLMDALRRAV